MSFSALPLPLPPSAFDFTKSRKKWAEILITELNVVTFILDATAKPLYCSTSAHEAFGWTDSEVVAMQNLQQLIHPQDHPAFATLFQQSARTRAEFVFYARFKPKPLPTASLGPLTYPAQAIVLNAADGETQCYEVKGSPYFSNPKSMAGPDCFFLMASPYPSPNTGMLDSLLDLKLENERLQQRSSQLRATLGRSSPSNETAHYRSGALRIRTAPPPLALHAPYTASQPASSTASMRSNTSVFSAAYGQYPVTPYSSSSFVAAPVSEGDPEEPSSASSKRRQRRKQQERNEARVCASCGRTNSPEWRKGPLGNKTLCNACGLRWAKTNKPSKETGQLAVDSG